MVDIYRQFGNPVDERTDNLGAPLPHLLNDQRDDVPRVRQALQLIDTALQLLGLDMDSRDTELSAQIAGIGKRAQLLEWAAARASAVDFTYDSQGRVQTIAQTVAGVSRTTTLTYDTQGRVATAAYPVASGATRTDKYQYDASGRAVGITSAEE
ncbi:MAG: hypothetical protein EOO29_44875 [Comamonadaceae bacterium]|nr:MAG: hypothetical protein EOO29_44875 [Comamonadaceae bacterium]